MAVLLKKKKVVAIVKTPFMGVLQKATTLLAKNKTGLIRQQQKVAAL